MSLFRDLEDAVETRLRARTELAGVPIIARRRGAVADGIEAAIAAHALCIYIAAPLPVQCIPNVPGPHFKRADLTLRIIELPPNNTGTLDAYDVAELVFAQLHQWKPELDGAQHLYVAEAPMDDVYDPDRVIFDLHFFVMLTLQPPA